MSQQESNTEVGGKKTPPEIPDFEMIRPVGRGGSGEVWLATNCTTGQLRAVKVIPLQHAGQADPAAREIASLTRLEASRECRHVNLLDIQHIGKTERFLFYVMDPADDLQGGPASSRPQYRPATLESRIQHATPSPKACMDYARQLLEGLAALHHAGMIHRDVKPANCLFVDGRLKLADFGLVTDVHPAVSRVGTQKYMPPDGRMDMRADVYAAGLVIYQMISGLPVEEFPSLAGEADRVREDPELATLLRIVLHACERDPELRPADVKEMLRELATSDDSRIRLPRRRLFAGGCAMGAACVGAVVWSLLATPHEERCDVNFVTDPFEARIYLDGVLQRDSEGNVYTTPCTVTDLVVRTYRVEFEYDGEPRWQAGSFDLAQTRQIVAQEP